MKKTLQLIHDDQLEKLLANLGLQEKINDSKLKCKFCREIVLVENIYSIFPESGSIKVACDKVGCIKALTFFLNSNNLESKEG